MLSDPRRKRHQTLAAVVALLLSAAPAQAGEPTDQLRTEIDRVIKVLEDPELKKENRARERQGEVREIASGIFDDSDPRASWRGFGCTESLLHQRDITKDLRASGRALVSR